MVTAVNTFEEESEQKDATLQPKRVQCTFSVTHNFVPISLTGAAEEKQATLHQGHESRPPLLFNTRILERLLTHVGASLINDAPSKAYGYGRTCQLIVSLDPGDPSRSVPDTTTNEDPDHLLLSNAPIGEEPTLEELSRFTETLKGKKVTLYASTHSSFAHHLSSYLTAWGLDVSHASAQVGSGTDADVDANLSINRMRGNTFIGPSIPESEAVHSSTAPSPSLGITEAGAPATAPTSAFVFIDDNVDILRDRLQKLRLTQAYPLSITRKRPSLAVHHRPKSSSHVPRSGAGLSSMASPTAVILHFTSLANYKLVQDIVQTDIALHAGTNMVLPEVMIIPKPAGPRRFLTALHTAVTKPVVDPFFSPIATSPLSTGSSSLFNFSQRTKSSTPPSPANPVITKPATPRTNSDRSTNRSPVESNHPDMSHVMPPSPLSMSEHSEYFSESSGQLGSSPSAGLVIQSSNGQPAGIVFHPKAKSNIRGSSVTPKIEREKPTSTRVERNWATLSRSPETDRRPSQPGSFPSIHSHHSARPDTSRSDANTQKSPNEIIAGIHRPEEGMTGQRRASGDAKVIPKAAIRRPGEGSQTATTLGGKKVPEAIVVPPISVLIVDGKSS